MQLCLCSTCDEKNFSGSADGAGTEPPATVAAGVTQTPDDADTPLDGGTTAATGEPADDAGIEQGTNHTSSSTPPSDF